MKSFKMKYYFLFKKKKTIKKLMQKIFFKIKDLNKIFLYY